jgi:predicted nucleic acid-binding protein
MPQSRMRRAICMDTSPLIWGIRGDATRTQEHMIPRARAFIDHLSEHKYAIMVPSPVIAEYFVGATATQIHEAELLRRGFEHPSLDEASAMLAVTLQRGGKLDEIHEEYGLPKQSIKIDAFIIAIAILNGAEKIITHDVDGFTKLAGGRIAIEDIPDLPKQGLMGFPEDSPAEGE